jgi:hypothetical protein
MKRFNNILAVLAIVMAIVCAFTTAPRKANPDFAVYGNIDHNGSVSTQEVISSQGEVLATKSSGFTSQELNAIAQEHCPAPNNIVCIAVVRSIDGQQDPATGELAPLATRAGTYE